MAQNLYDSLADTIEDLIRDRKLRWLIALPSGIGTVIVLGGTVLAATGVVPGLSLPVNVTLVVLAVFLGVSVLVLALSRRFLRGELARKNLVLERYGDRIREAQENNVDLFHTNAWDEEARVGKKGDTTIARTMTIRAGAAPVPAIWTLASRNSEAHLGQAVKDKVRIVARFIHDDGSEGTELVSIGRWEGDRSIRIFIFFDRDLSPQTEVCIRLVIHWPKYGADMLDGTSEINHWTFRRQTDDFKSLQIYEKSFAPKGVRITPLPGSPAPDRTTDATSGSTHVRLNLGQIAIGQEYGYRADLVR
jgi:hypothetical protein